MSGHATGAQNDNNMDYSKIMYVAVTGDTMYGENTASRPTQYQSGLDYDIYVTVCFKRRNCQPLMTQLFAS